jgi:hypothetical protein
LPVDRQDGEAARSERCVEHAVRCKACDEHALRAHPRDEHLAVRLERDGESAAVGRCDDKAARSETVVGSAVRIETRHDRLEGQQRGRHASSAGNDDLPVGLDRDGVGNAVLDPKRHLDMAGGSEGGIHRAVRVESQQGGIEAGAAHLRGHDQLSVRLTRGAASEARCRTVGHVPYPTAGEGDVDVAGARTRSHAGACGHRDNRACQQHLQIRLRSHVPSIRVEGTLHVSCQAKGVKKALNSDATR